MHCPRDNRVVTITVSDSEQRRLTRNFNYATLCMSVRVMEQKQLSFIDPSHRTLDIINRTTITFGVYATVMTLSIRDLFM
jgi:hypothetical protein